MKTTKQSFQSLEALIEKEILVLDGAMGTMIQKHPLTESDFRGERFKDWHIDVKGNNDLLSLTQREIIRNIHLSYLNAGSHIIETNTFNAQAISLADYQMQGLAYEINLEAAKLAREAIDNYYKTNDPTQINKKFVAGAIGPMNRTLSLSPDVNRPEFRAVTFDQVVAAYTTQIEGLIDGGVDILLVETIFDTLNAKAALFAIQQYFDVHQIELPIMISVTITDASGRTLSGQTLEAFYISIEHAQPFSIGLNCAFGGTQMRPYLKELSELASCYVSVYPNAGLPNAMGTYDEDAEITSDIIEDFARNGWVNIVGGCCGTTPDHIQAMAKKVKHYAPRKLTSFV